MPSIDTSHDVIVIGAGPAGLSLARSLVASGVAVAVVERQDARSLADPAADGREIALTHTSVTMLQNLDAWHRIAAADVSPLGAAVVRNGTSDHELRFQPAVSQAARLGQLVPNHVIRRALFESVSDRPGITMLCGQTASQIAPDPDGVSVTLGSGAILRGRLAVAADTRFSDMRRSMGIAASMRDFGKTMLVCRMAHALPHHAEATEWFSYGQTIAMLPLNGTGATPNLSSLVITLKAPEVRALMALDTDAFGAEITSRYENRLGAMELVGGRHCYPLVAVYAGRFVAQRFALVGDAAVGMHPVTAHGFNFGLTGQDILARLIADAAAHGHDIGNSALLATYETRLRRATRPLYLATNATALLYTDDRLPARVLRDAVIRAGERLSPVRRAIVAGLLRGQGRKTALTTAPA
jgi:ubiquinone biosynthesis UbiH/UbiF/VisC/COQ6 family hydroxylase